MREIAKKAGLSQAAVSMALRNLPALPEKTRQRVRKIAEEMGYRPDPVLGALNAYRQTNRTARYQATLAWVHLHAESISRGPQEWFVPAARRAEELGFLLEPFYVPALDDWRRLARTLRSRNIQGIVRTPVPWQWVDYDSMNPAAYPWKDFPWDDFSAISLGSGIAPEHHRVINHQFQSAGLAVAELAALGYRKIAIALHSIDDQERVDYRWLGGYLAECARQKLKPMYLMDGHVMNPRYPERVAEWVARTRPEAVIAPGDGDILPGLRLAGLRVPGDVAVVTLAVMRDHPELAAIDQNNRQIAETTINHLVDLIRRNERGIPSSPMNYLVKGIWKPGPSAPPRGKAGRSRRSSTLKES